MAVWDWIVNLFPRLYDLIDGALRSSLPAWLVYLIMGLIEMVVLIGYVLTMVMLIIYLERRLLGRFQNRIGPNRVGPFGLLQPIADAIKILSKEDIMPRGIDRLVYNLAPVAFFLPVLMAFAVIPFGRDMILTDLNVGVLYVFAITTTGILAVFMAGWSSNNKFALFGAMRAVAQLISYEIPMVLSVVGVLLMAGSLSLVGIVNAQDVPYGLLQPLGLLIFLIAASAELNRPPFDLMEAESELVTGYHVEYSGMKFGMFYLGELAEVLLASCLVTTFFLSGWKGPILPSYVWFTIKLLGVYVVLVWIRATLPRLRIDQVMGFAWKFLFPLALLNVVVTSLEALAINAFRIPWWTTLFVNIPLAGILILVMAAPFRLQGARRQVGAPNLGEAEYVRTGYR